MRTLPALVLVVSLALAPSIDAQSPPALAPEVVAVRDLLRENRIEDAIKAGERLVGQRAGDGKAWLWLGNAYGRQAQVAGLLSKPKWAGKCRDAYEQAQEVSPRDPDVRLALMQYYLQAPGFLGGGRDKAEAEVEALTGIGVSWGHIARAAILLADDERDAAIAAYRDAVAAEPDNYRAVLGLVSLHITSKQLTEARGVIEATLTRNPKDPVGLYMLGRIAVEDGQRIDDGINGLQAYLALENRPDELSAAAAWWRTGLLHEKAGRKAEAVQALQQAVSLDVRLEGAKKDLERLKS